MLAIAPTSLVAGDKGPGALLKGHSLCRRDEGRLPLVPVYLDWIGATGNKPPILLGLLACLA